MPPPPKKSSKKGSSKKKGKKGKKPKLDKDALYDEWLEFTVAEQKAADPELQKSNLNVIADVSGHERDWLLKQKGEKEDVTVKIKGTLLNNVVCFYFADLRNQVINGTVITPEIAKAYVNARTNGKVVQVILVSQDKKEENFNEFFKDQPWLAIPFGDKQIKWLTNKYNKQLVLPCLTIVGQDGKVVQNDGIKKLLLQPNSFPFCRANDNDVVALAQRRPNHFPCSVDACKCKKYVNPGSYKWTPQEEDDPTFRNPVNCIECAHADIYHIPIKEGEDDKKGKGGKGSARGKGSGKKK